MKPKFLANNIQSFERSISCELSAKPHNFDHSHYHNDYEIIFSLENKGKRYLGDSVEDIKTKDLILVGPNLPHYWETEDKYVAGLANKPKALSIKFENDFLGKDFFDLPEMSNVKNLLKNSSRGISVKAHIANRLEDKLLNIVQNQGWSQITNLIDVLCIISDSDYDMLSSEHYFRSFEQSDSRDKITIIQKFLNQNYDNNILLDDIAGYACMNKSALCRFYKNATKKTISESLNEIRIGIAGKKLLETSLSVAEIGYACGYENISYFNRRFRSLKNISPTEYRLKYANLRKTN
ncbi:AraC family transcriptional regulator [Pedobacter jamesrossensis]|uniref:AraC family transcriptional regulator n=1 Tax=Pedobacter jamesrossensis TaxID=1908238 RepID=A0ABV8NSP5_9SPHI